MRVVFLVAILVVGLAVDASAAWTRPVAGPVVGRFRVVESDPFAAGQRRGVDLAASPGGRVVAPCSGRVAFVGRVPRFGLGVSVHCGRLTATVLGLGGGLVRPGVLVHRGEVIGSVGSRGRVRLGARVTRLRFGYRDPLALVGVAPPLVGPGDARRPEPPPAPLAPSLPPPAVAAPRPAGAPALAWIGVALVACALPGGAIAWRVRRRSVPLARARRSQPR